MFIDFDDRDLIGYVPVDKALKGEFQILVDEDEDEDEEEMEIIE